MEGVFEDDGSSFESEIWADLETTRRAFGREAGSSSVRVRLTNADNFKAFKAGVESDKQLQLEAHQETAYYALVKRAPRELVALYAPREDGAHGARTLWTKSAGHECRRKAFTAFLDHVTTA